MAPRTTRCRSPRRPSSTSSASCETNTRMAATASVPGVTSRMGEALAGLVDGLVPAQIAPLLEGAAIRLPDLGAPLTIGAIEPDDGGYLVLTLAP